MSLKEELLDVSRSLLIREGFSKLSMRKIARKANVTATSIYLHFKNKDELLLAIIENSIANLTAALKEQMNPGDDPVTKFEKLADAFLSYAIQNPQEYEIIYMVRPEEMPSFPKDKFQEIRNVYELIAEIIREGQKKDLFIQDDPLVSAYTVWAQLHGVASVIIGKRLDTRIPQEEFIRQAKDHIIQGFVTQKTPA
ncbi:MAG: TetR/AcrR family transcriptional regulator [Balneolaceae bacterium]